MKAVIKSLIVISIILMFFSMRGYAFPESISNLTALSMGGVPEGKITLVWTVPDTRDGLSTPSQYQIYPAYELKYATRPITNSNYSWWGNTYDTLSWTNLASSGTIETRDISNLSPGVTYYFALKASDNEGVYGVWKSSIDVESVNTANFNYPYVNIAAPTFRYDKFAVYKTSVVWVWNLSPNAAGYRVKSATSSTNISVDLSASTTFWIQENLTPNSTASIYLQAFNGLISRDSGIITSSFTFANPPTNINVTANTVSSLAIQWDTNSNSPQTRYSVQIKGGPFPSFTKVMNLVRSTTHYDSGLTEKASYDYKVWATNNNGFPEEVIAEKVSYSTTTLSIPPSQPLLLGTSTGMALDGDVMLEWLSSGNDGTNGICTDYLLKWATYTITSQNFGTVASSLVAPKGQSVSGANERYTLTGAGLYPGATYSFALKARDNVGNYSIMSVAKSTATLDKQPNSPTNITAVVKSSYSANIAWSNPSFTGTDDRDKYKIYIASIPPFSQFVYINNKEVNHPTTFYMYKGLVAENSYYFKVSCSDKGINIAQGHFSGNALESTLSETSGLVRTPDSTSPARISAITALPGATEGKVSLRWTNTGDNVVSGAIVNGKLRIDWTNTPSPVFSTNPNAYTHVYRTTSTAQGVVNNYTVTGLTSGLTYYFRVWLADEANNWSGISKGATTYAQVDVTLPGAITKFSVQPGWRKVSLSWVSPGDDGYTNNISGGKFEIKYSSHSNMSSPFPVITISTSVVKGTVCSYTTPTNLSNKTTYYFSIRTADERGNWSNISVTTPSACPRNSPPSAFNLTSPTNYLIVGSSKPVFSWNNSTDSDTSSGDTLSYTLYYSTTVGVTGNVVQGNAGASLTFTPSTALTEDVTYYWKVKVSDLDSISTWSSQSWAVRINAVNSAPSSFNLVSPSNANITNIATPSLSWSRSTDKDPGDTISYRVDYSIYSNFISFSSSSWQSARSFVTPQLDENATYYWRVWASDGLKTTLCSTTFYFRVNAVLQQPVAFNLVSPANNTRFTANLINFTWDKTTQPDPAVDEKVKYNLSYSLFSDFVSSKTLTGLTNNTTSLVVPSDNHKYYWQIDAVGPYGMVKTSNQRLMFYTDAIKELPVWSGYELISPTGSIKITDTLTPLFKWNSAADADPVDTIRYFLQYSVVPTFEGAPTIPIGTDTYYQPLSDSPLLDQSTYYWRVRVSGFDQSIPPNQVDTAYTFTSVGVFIISMTNNPPKTFDLTSPANAGLITTKTPSFSWSESVDTDLNDYVRYSLYISSISDFSSIYFSTTSLSTASLALPKRLLENRQYWWKVVSNDRKGLKTICISSFTFTVPVLNIPVAPSGLKGDLSDNQQNFTLFWSTAVKNEDGTDIDDLSGYKIYRALSLSAFNYTTPIVYISSGTNQWTDTTTQGGMFYYLVRSMDTSGIESQNSMILESLNPDQLNIVSSDNEVLVVVPKDVSKNLLAENNALHKNLSLNIERKTSSETDTILRVYDVNIIDAQLNKVSDYKFDTPLSMEFNYSDISQSIARKARSIQFNPNTLALYWDNGVEYIKVGGYANTTKKKFIALAIKPGAFQLRQTSLAAGFGLASLTPKKVFTPGISPYEKMTFIINNPTGDKVLGKVYDLKGEFVADLKALSDPTNTTVILEWDGKEAHKGVYIYQIEAEGKVINGTIMVVR
ncbi:MAG: fibronectin type III domain-containing protein [Elusimicrobia bacterium]|nr:fibronectin type III domain-containing protein [Candidatus Liberimonas magnetica]